MTCLFLSVVCVHSAGQCSTNQSITHRLCVRTRKIAQVYTAFTGKRVLGNDNQTQFIREYVTVYIYQITPYFLGGLCSLYRAAFCSILRNENQRHLDLFSLAFRKRCRCTGIYCWIYFRIQPCKWKTTAAGSCQIGYLLFGHGRIHWQGLFPTGHEQGRVEGQSGNHLRQIVP